MPILKTYKQTINYQLADNSKVFITVIIGEAQIGASKVYFSDDENNIICKGEVDDFGLGAGDSLKNKELIVKTTVLDSNTNTNNVSITIHLKQNDQVSKTIYTNKVENDRDALRLITKIIFS